MRASHSGSIHRDVLSAYIATGSRILSWIVVTAIVYRRLGAASFALLALVRTTIGLLNFTTLGLAPAMIRMLAAADKQAATLRPAALPVANANLVLNYATLKSSKPEDIVYSSAMTLALLLGILGTAIAMLYASAFPFIHRLPNAYRSFNESVLTFVLCMGMGTVLRLMSDAPGAALQVKNCIALDNLLVGAADLLWMGIVNAEIKRHYGSLVDVGIAWLASGAILIFARWMLSMFVMLKGSLSPRHVRLSAIRNLLSFGLLVALAQAADFLYAPTDNILINRFINPLAVAAYAPAIQIDAGLLLLVSGLAAVLLPRLALAHAAGDHRVVRRYYFGGTLASLGLLIPAALLVWLAAPWLFRLWLGDPMPTTLAILPLVLIHTVVGGSSAVGRSILLGMGKVKPFTAAALISGTGNVLLSFAFVRYCGWGLPGIVLGTIVAVVGRCAVWMPWYVMRVLRQECETISLKRPATEPPGS